MSWFTTWSMTWPKGGGQDAADGGYDVHLAWQPETDDDRPIPFADILAGEYDEYLERFFERAADHPGRVTIRFAHEPNGSSYPWSLGYRHGGPLNISSTAEYRDCWRYLVEFQRASPAQNVDWAWCISTSDRGGVPAEEYWPGADVVDVLSGDVYVGYGGGWQTPTVALNRIYDRLTALHPAAPVWISEIGCREPSKDEPGAEADPSHDKSVWLTELFGVTGLPRLTTICLFNAARTHDWRVQSSPGSLQVVQAALGGRHGE